MANYLLLLVSECNWLLHYAISKELYIATYFKCYLLMFHSFVMRGSRLSDICVFCPSQPAEVGWLDVRTSTTSASSNAKRSQQL